MKNRLVLLLVLGGFSGCSHAPVASAPEGEFQQALASMGLAYEGAVHFEVEKSFIRGDWSRQDDPAFWTLIATSGQRKARFESTKNIDESDARARADERFLTVQKLNAGPAAYPGMVTQTTEIPDALKPVVIEDDRAPAKAVLLPATARLTYGVGAPDLAAYWALMTSRYCPQTRTLILVEFFYPATGFDKALTSKTLEDLSCRP